MKMNPPMNRRNVEIVSKPEVCRPSTDPVNRLDAVGVTRQRCWKYDWVLEFDIKGLFDNIDHELLLRAVRKHVTCAWALLYIERCRITLPTALTNCCLGSGSLKASLTPLKRRSAFRQKAA